MHHPLLLTTSAEGIFDNEAFTAKHPLLLTHRPSPLTTIAEGFL
jgi:hypothetical protein